jgi:hypothetical protein
MAEVKWKLKTVRTPFEIAREITVALSWCKHGAGDGDRTRDIQLGKLAFYR